ncbi:MAG: ABC transporter permease, partial [Chloroflexota bacterium]|nr:ABC transporter permease [Chloroflexota bacterium]
MSTSTQAIQHEQIYEVSPTRKLVMGILEFIISAFIFLVFVRTVSAAARTTFVMTPGGIDIGKAGDWILPTRLTLILLAVFALAISLFQLIKGFGRFTNAMVGLCGLFLVFGFLTWQAA